MTSTETSKVKTDELKVVVHFVAAEEPFKGTADRDERVGELKARVLLYFVLEETTDAAGNITTYPLYLDKQPLEDVNARLGDIVGEKKVLQLKLSKVIVQGEG
jgi:hypothetical protein